MSDGITIKLNKTVAEIVEMLATNVFEGFSCDALRDHFANICDPVDWRKPIDTVVHADQLGMTIAAIRFMTACEPRYYKPNGFYVRVTAAGYRAGPAGP